MTTSISNIDYSISNLTAPELCSYLIENDLEELYAKVPDQWVQQAQAGFEFFELNSEDIELDLVRIQLNTVKYAGDDISCKLRLSAVLDKVTGQLCPMSNQLTNRQVYIGFNSPALILPADILSRRDYTLLERYEAWWNSASKAHNMFKEYSNYRLWLKPAKSFKMQFKLDVRLNPSNGVNVLGISSDLRLRGVTFFDTFSCVDLAESLESIEPSKGQRTGRLKMQAAQGIRLPNRQA